MNSISTIYGKVKNLFKTKAELDSLNPILLQGEMGIESDTNKVKYGNGTDNWSDLPYATSSIKWSIDSDYVIGDFVTNDSKLWTAIADSTGVEPGTDDEVWTEFTSGGGSYDIGDIVFTASPALKPGFKWCDYEAISQSLYSVAFELFGHLYAKNSTDAIAANNAGLFHVPDSHLAFTRGGKSWSIDDGNINANTITLNSHKLPIDGSADGRVIKLQRFPNESPTMPTSTGYTEYDQHYIRVIDANTIELYASEIEAINTAATTGRLDWSDPGSGTFMLTTMGCYQESASQRIYGEFNSSLNETNSTSGTGAFASSVQGGRSGNLSNMAYYLDRQYIKFDSGDSVGEEHTSDNETRPSYASLGMQIKVIGTSVSTGQAYDMLAWDSGWITNSDWTNAKLPADHGLDTSLSGLIVKLYISSDGGGLYYFDSSGATVVLDTATMYYKIAIYKPDLTAVTIPVAGTTYEKDTGWIANSGWIDTEFSFTHNYGENFPGLLVEFFVSETGADTNAIRVDSAGIPWAGVANTGLSLHGVDSNTIKGVTSSGGIVVINEDDYNFTRLTTQAWYYKIVVRKPNVLDEVVPISSVTYEWDSGWVTPADWTNATETLTHGLNEDAVKLVYEGWVKCDEFGEQRCLIAPFETGGGAHGGASILKIDGNDNAVSLDLGDTGPVILQTAGVWVFVSTYTNPQYRVIIRKANILTENVVSVQGQVMTDDLAISLEAGTDWVTVDASAITVADKTLTVSQGGGAGIMNRLKFVGSDTVQTIVTDSGGNDHIIEPKQVVDFYLKGTDIAWASGSWETLWYDADHASNQKTFEVGDGLHEVLISQGDVSTYQCNIIIDSLHGQTNCYGVWNKGYDVKYTVSSNLWDSYLAGAYLKRIRLWHEGA